MGAATLKRGLKNIFCAEILHDDNETNTAGQGETPNHGYVTGTPFHLIPAGEMSRKVESEKKNVFYDDTVFGTYGKEGVTEISINGAALRPNDIAKITGKYVDPTTDAVLDTGDFEPKYFAIGGETENVDGTVEYFWFLKGTFDIPERNDKTKDDTTDTNGMTLVFKAVKTEHLFTVDSKSKTMKVVNIDTNNTVLKASQSWTAQVVSPENLSTVVQKKT